MSRSIRRRDFLIAAGAAGTACLPAPSVRAFGGLQAAPADPGVHVYLAFGQSNMEGFPGIEARDKESVDPRFRMLAAVDLAELGRKRGEWYPHRCAADRRGCVPQTTSVARWWRACLNGSASASSTFR